MSTSESLAKHTYWKIGGPCDRLVIPDSVESLSETVRRLALDDLPYFVLGLGSNLLVGDNGYAGTVIKTTKCCTELSAADQGGDLWVTAGAGVGLFPLLRRAAAEGWAGLEFLAGIPGTVGGAVAMNAGTHLGETKDCVISVDWLDNRGEAHTTSGRDLKFEYRKNLFLPEGAVATRATFKISRGDPTGVARAIGSVLERRKQSQPIDLPSCGSVFKNPPGAKAWEVIERLGLRGRSRGGAQISEKHPNFIVNLGGATAVDVLHLMRLVMSRAQAELGVRLEPEVKMLGCSLES